MRLIIRMPRRLHKKICIAKSNLMMRDFDRQAKEGNFLF
ncbi:hypothetical protein F01_350065 [Burkholderia cenocepacia]|nr:hypothetical protein F01_350065 [Burkholderia cenocepacia]